MMPRREVREVQAAARAIGQEVILLEAPVTASLKRPLQLFQRGAGALIVVGGAFMTPIENGSLPWRLDMAFPRCTTCASSQRQAAL